VLVTALGNDTHTCRVVGWSASGANEVVAVRCHTVAGVAVDARFSVMFHDDERACSGTSFAWADQPAAASYTPSRFYSGNDTMEAQTITRSGPGLYTATLRGLPAGPSGNVIVTAYGSPETTRCKVQSWSRSGTNATVNVRCHTAAGVAADSRFTLAFDANGVPGRVVGGQNLGAYLWADQAATASYTPSAAYRFNSREIVGLAAAPTITRAARGDYTARLRALPVAGGNAQVTAYGGTTEVCKVVSTAAAGGRRQCPRPVLHPRRRRRRHALHPALHDEHPRLLIGCRVSEGRRRRQGFTRRRRSVRMGSHRAMPTPRSVR
jgi:hypothetical protein